jgi:hypothetical protein
MAEDQPPSPGDLIGGGEAAARVAAGRRRPDAAPSARAQRPSSDSARRAQELAHDPGELGARGEDRHVATALIVFTSNVFAILGNDLYGAA